MRQALLLFTQVLQGLTTILTIHYHCIMWKCHKLVFLQFTAVGVKRYVLTIATVRKWTCQFSERKKLALCSLSPVFIAIYDRWLERTNLCQSMAGKDYCVPKENCSEEPIMITIPFKDQRSADGTRKQLQSLSSKIGVGLQPVFTSQKIGGVLKTREPKPKIISQQCVVYLFKCGRCDNWTMSVIPTDTCINVLPSTVLWTL